jgi:hypothetical protein
LIYFSCFTGKLLRVLTSVITISQAQGCFAFLYGKKKRKEKDLQAFK